MIWFVPKDETVTFSWLLKIRDTGSFGRVLNLDSDFAYRAVKVQIPGLPEVFIVLDGLHVVLSDSVCVCLL